MDEYVREEGYYEYARGIYETRTVEFNDDIIKTQLERNDFEFEIDDDKLIVTINPPISYNDRLIFSDSPKLIFKKVVKL